MTKQLLLHKNTEIVVKAALARKNHALCIVGAYGSGKVHLAEHIADNLLQNNNKTASLKYIRSDGNISIEQIREMQSFLKLKTTGGGTIRRIVIIEDAHKLSTEAQNALLKNLEEPPEDSVIILTVAGDKLLLPTLYSRSQTITVKPPPLNAVLAYFEGSFTKADITKSYHVSGGNVGLLYALLTNGDHELINHIETAKKLLKSSAHDRLVLVDQLSKDKLALPMLFYALKRVITSTMHLGTSNKQLQRTLHALTSIYQAEASLKHNPNTKLLLTDLFLQM